MSPGKRTQLSQRPQREDNLAALWETRAGPRNWNVVLRGAVSGEARRVDFTPLAVASCLLSAPIWECKVPGPVRPGS